MRKSCMLIFLEQQAVKQFLEQMKLYFCIYTETFSKLLKNTLLRPLWTLFYHLFVGFEQVFVSRDVVERTINSFHFW